MPALITGLVVSLLMGFCVAADIQHHDNRRSHWWVGLGFLLGPVGVGAYLIWDRWKK